MAEEKVGRCQSSLKMARSGSAKTSSGSQMHESQSKVSSIYTLVLRKIYASIITRNVDDACDVFVVPRKHITATTSAALDHPELVRHKNAWGLLTASDETLSVIPPVMWKEPTIPPPPTRHSLILQEVVCKAESIGLVAESTLGEVTSHKGVQSFLYISKKRCQVMEANVTISNSGFRYISLILRHRSGPSI